jgi:hypothetical protein
MSDNPTLHWPLTDGEVAEYLSKGPRCHSCGKLDCPASGKDYVDDCPLWQECEARAARGEYLTTRPRSWPGMAPNTPPFRR